jgi:hypothetical protein
MSPLEQVNIRRMVSIIKREVADTLNTLLMASMPTPPELVEYINGYLDILKERKSLNDSHCNYAGIISKWSMSRAGDITFFTNLGVVVEPRLLNKPRFYGYGRRRARVWAKSQMNLDIYAVHVWPMQPATQVELTFVVEKVNDS